MEHINWYPGHMKKTRELIQENLKLVDAVLEVIDARIPRSSRNPIIDELVKGKKRILVFNKSDLADNEATKAWAEEFQRQGFLSLTTNCMSGEGTVRLLKRLEDEGLVQRSMGVRDARMKRITPTLRAQALNQEAERRIAATEATLTRGISQEEFDQFLAIAEKLKQNLI